jgi:hypothetical protein
MWRVQASGPRKVREFGRRVRSENCNYRVLGKIGIARCRGPISRGVGAFQSVKVKLVRGPPVVVLPVPVTIGTI